MQNIWSHHRWRYVSPAEIAEIAEISNVTQIAQIAQKGAITDGSGLSGGWLLTAGSTERVELKVRLRQSRSTRDK